MKQPNETISDNRPIDMLRGLNDNPTYQVDMYGVTKIVPYRESGSMAYITWFAIYDETGIIVRVPPGNHIVEY